MRSLAEELSATRQRLVESTNESSALHEHIRTLEKTQDEQLRQRVEQAVNHTKDELVRVHASEMENQQETVRALERRNEELLLRIKSLERETSELGHAHNAEVKSLELRIQSLQESLESLQHELNTKDDKMVALVRENEDLRKQVVDIEKDSRVLAEGGKEAQRRLIDEVNQLRRHLQDAHALVMERDDQITVLQSAKAEMEVSLRGAQAVVDEREMVIGDLRRCGDVFGERNRLLEQKVVEMEREISDNKESAKRVLETTVDDYERRIVDAIGTIQGLQTQLSSSATTIQQLQSALDSTRDNAEEATQTTAGYMDELRELRNQRTAHEETIRALEEQNKALQTEKAELVRTYTCEIEAEKRAIHNLRRSMETSERDHSARQERSAILVQANEELRREIMSLKELREQEEKESGALRKDLEVANATLCALEEKGRISLEAATEEKKKLAEEVDQLRRQLEDVQGQLKERDAQAQTCVVDAEKLKNELQTAISTIAEQKAVIARLQQSIGERSKDDRQPRLLLNVVKGNRSDNRRRRSSTVSRTEPPKAVEMSKRSTNTPSRNEAPRKPIRRESAPPATPTSTVAKQPDIGPSGSPRLPVSPTHEAVRMLKDHEQAFQANSTDSDSEGDHHSSSQRQVRDVKRLTQQTQAGLAYRMGHAVFGSLWRRIWG